MKPINLAINVFLIFVLLVNIYNKRYSKDYENSILILITILIILFCLCSFKTLEHFENENEKDKIAYDYDTFTTKELKVIKKLDGLIKQINNSIPIGFVYLSIYNNNPGTFLGGTWKTLNLNSNADNQYTFIMTANDEDKPNYENDNKHYCAFKKEIDNVCNDKKSFDLVENIEYVDNMRVYGGTNEVLLNINNVPPHIHYLRGIKGEKLNSDNETCSSESLKCSNCYNQSKFGFYIDNGQVVGNAIGAKEHGILKRITYKDHDKGAHTTSWINNKYKQRPKDEYDKTTKKHDNKPPYVVIYGWRKISND